MRKSDPGVRELWDGDPLSEAVLDNSLRGGINKDTLLKLRWIVGLGGVTSGDVNGFDVPPAG